ncbi:MAG: clostripain-related cysteine peptidase [Chloroflexi bacterium]|nr:clostripain-related cysteine peptidase [Chloroflexota bacterium]
MDIKRTDVAKMPEAVKPQVKSETKNTEKEAAMPKDTVTISGGKADTGAIKPKAKWLFLNYVAADCNLTEQQLKNLDQQELVGSDKNTHIVAYVDVGPNKDPLNNQWNNARSLYITKDSTPNKLNSELIEDFGPVDMSSPETLKRFIVDAIKKFPADHVALILNDHGGGFTGAMADDTNGNFMSMPGVGKALKEAEKVTGKKIDIVGFDACLMAETEVAYEIKDNADIMLASEESEGGAGWTYDPMLGGRTLKEAIGKTQKLLSHKIAVGPEDFAKIVVDVNAQHQGDIPTFSATRLNKIDDLSKSTDMLAETILKTGDKDSIKQAIKEAEAYGGGWAPYKDIHDLHHVCTNIIGKSSDEVVKKAAEGVLTTLNDVILANENNPSSYPNSRGISIYAPETSSFGYDYKDLAFAKKTKWDEAVQSLYSTTAKATESTPSVWPDGSPRKPKKS